ncbi:interferon alpha/beta receptor 2-like [Mustelus asterias]
MFKVVDLFYHLQFLNSVIAMVPPPVNLSFISENLHHVLMWEAGTDTPSTTRYTVQYLALSTLGMEQDPLSANQTDDEETSWLAAKNCSLITNRTCDLTNDFTNIYEAYFVRVKAVTEMDGSNWTSSNEFQPFENSKIRPVNFHLSEDPIGVLKVNFDIPSIPPSIPGFGFKSLLTIHSALFYHIIVFKNGQLEKIRDVLGCTMEMSVEQVAEVQPNTHYCVTLTVFTFEEDQSDPLEMKCIATRYKREDKEPQILLTVLCVFGVGFVISIIVLCKGGYLGFLGKYGPKALSNLKHIHPVYQSNNMQVKLSTLEPVNFRKEKKIENIEEDSEEELMSSYQETGYEQNSLTIPVQNSAQSSSASSKVGTDEASTVSCDDQLCDSAVEHLFTNLDDCQLAPTDMMQNEIPDAETTSQAQTIHSRKSSSASANINVPDVPLWSIQIQDPDSCFVDFSNEKMFDQEADEPNPAEPDDLNDSLLPKVCGDPVIYQYENPSLYDIPVISSSPVLHSDYMKR